MINVPSAQVGVGDVPRKRKLLSGVRARTLADGTTVYDVNVRRNGRTWRRTCYSLPEAEQFRAAAIAASRGDSARDPLPDQRRPDDGSAPLALVAADQFRRMEARTLLLNGRPYKLRSIRVNADAVRLDIAPALGALAIGSITRRDIKRFLDELASTKPHRARKARAAIGTIFRIAVDEEVIEQSPMQNIPSYVVPSSREWVYFDPKYHEPALAWARQEDARLGRSLLYPAFGVAIHAALRTGEVLGLTWGPMGVDFMRREIHVTQQVSSERDESANYAIEFPKPGRFHRVGMNERLEEILLEHRANLEKCGRDVSDGAMLFVRPEGLYYSPNRTLITPWYKCMAAIGHPKPWPTVHALRHALASDCLEASGGNLHVAAALLGHSSVQMVMSRYGHALDHTKRAMPDLVAEARRARANPEQDPSES
jgi:integrase